MSKLEESLTEVFQKQVHLEKQETQLDATDVAIVTLRLVHAARNVLEIVDTTCVNISLNKINIILIPLKVQSSFAYL